ncbi:MAG: hypothetical protein WCO28_02955 [Bacteroidota bacterium]|jgi:hypothetical protein
MKVSDKKIKAFQLIDEFENIKPINLSADWNQSFHRKTTSSLVHSKISNTAKFISVALVFTVLNFSLVIGVLSVQKHRHPNRDRELEIISKELLINPISINN